MPETKLERSTPFICKQCLAEFEVKNRNGKRKEFCSRRCKDRYGNAQRLKGAALLKEKQPRRRGPSKHAQKVSHSVCMALVPVEERAELLRQAVVNLGITDESQVVAAFRRTQVLAYEGTV